ncbi:NUDIX domain-containing protein [Paenibacillus tritici]|uniref:NUDIX hydrolase n=1 Tax=Paenibacillus tritici TaxID=1873425 RepID=UPI001BA5B6CF|nr:NUDIX domain-containing protein [Paenibacillus tritici]QUL57075.1 NUDIX domain-containing protein [Paenibacillus tritici]
MADYIKYLREYVGSQALLLPGAAVILNNTNGEILIQHRIDNNMWGLPGGFMELGESLEECSRREFYEETGLKLGELQLINVYSGKDFFYQYPNGDQVFFVTAIYYADTYYGNIRLDSPETKDLKFVSISEIFSMGEFDINDLRVLKLFQKNVRGKLLDSNIKAFD